ncbi:MAG: ATP-binding protein [Thermodesulfobacteriota bacterium]|nr:ATP-binding protein [Thermodesulfobacteriota bacterium]
MTPKELQQLIAEVQKRQSEFDHVEVKTARGGTPRRLYEPVSAFANRTGGGVILFGLDESKDFSIVGVGDAHRLQEEITHLASDNMEPALRPQFLFDEIEDEAVVAVEIEEVPAAQKPCFYKQAGLPKGAYLRVGNTNRQMTEYEVFGYLSGRAQPTHDEEIVPDATMEDLDKALLDDYLARLRRYRPQASFLEGSQEEVLIRLRVIGLDDDLARPTVAGLLMFGKYPQEFFPQMMITFVQYYGTTEDERTPKGARFVDNRRFEGHISEMVEEVEAYVLSSMRKSSLIEGMFRRDIPEYPQEALREALANAIAHRDYSPYARGSHVQISMFADRLEIQSPGGLFGNVTLENLEEEHSTRNARLMRMMEDMHIVENRGSGIRAMLMVMREANLEPPGFDDRRSSFRVTFRNHTLMNPEAIAWLNQFSDISLDDRQRLALVYLRQRRRITNSDYRRLNHVDSTVASQELRGLVQAGLIEQKGVGRWTTYTLKTPIEILMEHKPKEPQKEGDQILAYVKRNGSINNMECQKLLNVNRKHAWYLLNKLCKTGKLGIEGKGRWSTYRIK